jgi:hypothetical protein
MHQSHNVAGTRVNTDYGTGSNPQAYAGLEKTTNMCANSHQMKTFMDRQREKKSQTGRAIKDREKRQRLLG